MNNKIICNLSIIFYLLFPIDVVAEEVDYKVFDLGGVNVAHVEGQFLIVEQFLPEPQLLRLDSYNKRLAKLIELNDCELVQLFPGKATIRFKGSDPESDSYIIADIALNIDGVQSDLNINESEGLVQLVLPDDYKTIELVAVGSFKIYVVNNLNKSFELDLVINARSVYSI
ncbi:DUF5462 family protein [Shewanella gaetbuli]|uniref:DUF5462 family protein n=1 Tax=Shewanella gaetbuli TaxID=220752 RepID=A0A9X1ZIJ8_9GAMM|nr:DUF5462 family protein [Shewanella gaetbuli]